MKNKQNVPIFLLRISFGWMFLYAGVTKILDPAWSAAGYIGGASTFAGFYQWMLSPAILPAINFLNEWGLLLLGLALILGLFVRLSSFLGIVLMLLYYFALSFPFPNAHSLIVDEHVIYVAGLLVLLSTHAGKFWGLDPWLAKQSAVAKMPWLKKLVG
jgi:thiosulfate dehydrogenase [quinone] large subunit